MRVVGWVCFLCLLLLPVFVGCRSGAERAPRSAAPARPALVPTPDRPLILPANLLSGKIARVNVSGRFAVITFPVGQIPALEQRLNIYRQGLKVGEVKITGPQQDDSIVADITAGEVRPGDDVRP
jgi:hypothetical protein